MRFLKQLVAIFGVHARDVMARPINSLVAASGAAGTAFVLVSVLSVADGLASAIERAGSRSVGVVVAQDAQVETSSVLPEDSLQSVLNALGNRTGWRESASPELVRPMDTISRGGEAGSQVIGRGIGPAGLRLRPHFRIVAGRMFRPGAREVIVGRRLARDVKGLAIGEQVTGGAHDWEVVGVFEDNGGLDESEVWSDLDTTRAERGGRTDVSSVRVPLSSSAGLTELGASLAANPQQQLRVLTERDYQTELSMTLMKRVRTVAFVLAVLLGVGAIVAMINTTYSAIAARERCISTLRAIGFGGGAVAIAVFFESLLLGCLGGIAGGAAAALVANGWALSLFNTATFTPIALEATVTWSGLSYGVLGGVMLGALAAVIPSVKIAGTDVLAGSR